LGVDLDHSAILRPYSRNSSGIDAHRLHIIGFNLWAEAGRAIVRQGIPSITNCVWYSEPRGCSTALPHRASPVGVTRSCRSRPGTEPSRFWMKSVADLIDGACLVRVNERVAALTSRFHSPRTPAVGLFRLWVGQRFPRFGFGAKPGCSTLSW